MYVKEHHHITTCDNFFMQIYYHDPYDLPTPAFQIKTTEYLSSFISLSFNAISITASDHIKQLFVSQRKCRFPDESNLQHFPDIYAYSLCKIECKIQIILKLCNCLPIFYKALPGEKYCNSVGLKCIAWYNGK